MAVSTQLSLLCNLASVCVCVCVCVRACVCVFGRMSKEQGESCHVSYDRKCTETIVTESGDRTAREVSKTEKHAPDSGQETRKSIEGTVLWPFHSFCSRAPETFLPQLVDHFISQREQEELRKPLPSINFNEQGSIPVHAVLLMGTSGESLRQLVREMQVHTVFMNSKLVEC